MRILRLLFAPRIELAERYCDTIEAEWKWRRNETDGLLSRPTLYIGGGTPSALPRHLLQRIIELLATPDMTEITIEVNPEDVDSEFVRWLDDTPVSRVSMGIQSLRDEELAAVGRRHTASDALKALDLLDCLTTRCQRRPHIRTSGTEPKHRSPQALPN